MSLLKSFMNLGLSVMDLATSNISAERAKEGGTFTTNGDVFVAYQDRDEGYTEICVAKDGDLVEAIEMDAAEPGNVRVVNQETGDVVSVPLASLEEL